METEKLKPQDREEFRRFISKPYRSTDMWGKTSIKPRLRTEGRKYQPGVVGWAHPPWFRQFQLETDTNGVKAVITGTYHTLNNGYKNRQVRCRLLTGPNAGQYRSFEL